MVRECHATGKNGIKAKLAHIAVPAMVLWTCFSQVLSHLRSLAVPLASCSFARRNQQDAKGKMPVRANFVAKRFAVPNNHVNFALNLSHALQGGSPKGQERQAGHIHNGKGVSCALVLTIEELRKLYGLSKTKQRGRPMRVYYIHSFRSLFWRYLPIDEWLGLYIHIAWGFQRCSFRQSGQCEGLSIVERVTDWLHILFCV